MSVPQVTWRLVAFKKILVIFRENIEFLFCFLFFWNLSHFPTFLPVIICFKLTLLLPQLASYIRYFFKCTQVSQKLSNILVIWSTIQQLWKLLLNLWRWQTILDCEMPSSPDTLWVLLTGFAWPQNPWF